MTIDRFYFHFSDNDLLEHMDDVGDAHHLIHAGADRIRTIKAENALLRDVLKEVMLWVDNWTVPFKEDDEWPQTEAKVKEALKEKRE